MNNDEAVEAAPRRRGRPRADIDVDDLAGAVARLFREGGLPAVSIGGAARHLDVSRATLYRNVPTRHALMGALFERGTTELTSGAVAIVESDLPVRDKLAALIGLQVGAAVRMRDYLPMVFDTGEMPADLRPRWCSWVENYEKLWAGCVSDAMAEDIMRSDDPMVVARCLIGMCMWVPRWYRKAEGISVEAVTDATTALLLPSCK